MVFPNHIILTMLHPAHRQLLINELIKGIENIGSQYEAFGRRLVDFAIGERMTHRGLNVEGQPVGHTVDSFSQTGQTVAEYSAEQDYFEKPYSKLIKDLKHARKLHPQAKRILLLSSRLCGPKLNTRLVNVADRAKKIKAVEVEVYDARRQAELIVDNLLLNDGAVDALSPYLAPLEKVRAESAATNLLPTLDPAYLRRPELEDRLKQQMKKEQVVALAGLSGIGKSESSVAVATDLTGEFEMVIWVSGKDISSTYDLQAFAAERRGQRLNVLHLLRDRACLVILDDLRLGVKTVDLKKYCGPNSAILITRQQVFDGDIEIPFLGKEDTHTLLQRGITEPCPATIFETVWRTVGGHPLALRLMNTGVRNGSWNDLSGDCEAIGEYPDTDKLQRLADRLLGRLVERLLKKELAFFVWCESPRVDRSFARHSLGSVGLRKLQEACLLAADRDDIVRLHDIVYSALWSLRLPVEEYDGQFNTRLDSHVQETALGSGSELGFMNFLDAHGSKLAALIEIDPQRSSLIYSMTHAWTDKTVDLSLLGDPLLRAKEIRDSGEAAEMDVTALCESIEAIYRKIKYDAGIDAARKQLETYLPAFTLLSATPNISSSTLRTVLHHQAKALRNLQRFDEAIPLCEQVLADYAHPATKLLLARILFGKKEDKALVSAKDLLFELLEEAKTSPTSSDIRVTLAAIETLGWGALSKWFPEALDKFGRLVTDYIVQAALRMFDHAFVAFGSIGRTLQFNNPDLFYETLKALPERTIEEARDDKERAAWAEIYLSAASSSQSEQREAFAIKALGFYKALEKPNSFNLQQQGHVLFLLNQHDEAIILLEKLVNEEPNPWNRYWLSKCLLARGDIPKSGLLNEALRLVDEALEDSRSERYESMLLEHRWEIRSAARDPGALQDLQRAHDSCCDNDKYKKSLAAKLDQSRQS